VVTIETTSPLKDHAEESIRVSIEAAVRDAVTSAIAIGLPWIRMGRALVLEDAVMVQILATDTDPETGTGEDVRETYPKPETRAEEPPQFEL
jgi:hypothetical protein